MQHLLRFIQSNFPLFCAPSVAYIYVYDALKKV